MKLMYESLYKSSREGEIQDKEILLNFERAYPNTLSDEKIEVILEKANGELRSGPKADKKSILAQLEAKKAEIRNSKTTDTKIEGRNKNESKR